MGLISWNLPLLLTSVKNTQLVCTFSKVKFGDSCESDVNFEHIILMSIRETVYKINYVSSYWVLQKLQSYCMKLVLANIMELGMTIW